MLVAQVIISDLVELKSTGGRKLGTRQLHTQPDERSDREGQKTHLPRIKAD